MAYVMTLFWRSTKPIFCHGMSLFFTSPMLGSVLEKEDDFEMKKMIEMQGTHLHAGQFSLQAPGTLVT